MRPPRSPGSARLGGFVIVSGLLHLAIPFLLPTASARPAPLAAAPAGSELPIEASLGLPRGAAASPVPRSRPTPSPGPSPAPIVRSSHELEESSSNLPRPVAVASTRASAAPVASAAPASSAAPAGVAGGGGEQGKGKGPGVGYLSGWFSSRISARQLSLSPEEQEQAQVIATITLADGRIQAAAVAAAGPVPRYSEVVASALSGLVGQAIPPDAEGEFPEGTFSLRLRPR